MIRSARSAWWFAALVLAVGGGAWWLLQSHDSEESTPRRELRGAAPETPAAAPAAPTAERTALDAAPVAPAAKSAPSDYVAALGGFTGRLLEPDLTPARLLPVSIVEFEPSGWLLDTAALLEETKPIPPLEKARALTGDDGRFELHGIEPRSANLLGIDLGGPRSAFRVIDRSAVTGEMVDLGDLVLEPYVTFTGRVIDDEGQPVAGARVRATNLPSIVAQFGIEEIRRGCGVMVELPSADKKGSPKCFEVPPVVWEYERLLPIPTTTSGDDGRFELPGVPLGLVTVIADKLGWHAASKSMPSGKGPKRDVRDLILTSGYVLHGVVVRGDGTPVAGVEILAGIRSALAPVPVALMQPAGRTDSNGAFSLSGLPTGSDGYIATRLTRGQPWNVHGPYSAVDEELRVELSPPSGFTVRLHDAGGAPIELAASVDHPLELFIAPDPIEGGAPLPPILAPPMMKLTEVESIGPGRVRVTGLDFGVYRLIGRAPGLALAQTKVTVAEPPQEFELAFEAANTLEIHVVRKSDAKPLDWAFASLCPEGFFERPVARGRTNPQGLITLDRIPAGKYVLTVQHPAQATQELKIEIPCAPVTVALPLGGNLKGRISDRGRAPGKSLFVIVMQDGVRRPDAAMPTFSASTEDGDYAVVNLEVGKYKLEVRDRIVGKGPLALFETMQDDPLIKAEFEIREGETTTLDLDTIGLDDGPVASLSGSVLINGVPKADLSVRLEGKKRITAKTDESGRFLFETAPAGKTTLSIQGMRGEGDLLSLASVLHREEFELAGGEHRELQLALEVASVGGWVSGPGVITAGLPATVILRSPDGGPGQFATTNMLTGGYEFLYVPRGHYDLVVSKRGAAPFSQPIDVDPAHGDVTVDIALVDSIHVAGRFALPEGEAAPEPQQGQSPFGGGGFLRLVNSDGSPAGYGRLDWTNSTFTVDDCAPGTFDAQLFLGTRTFVARGLVVPAHGSDDLFLQFEKPKEGETIAPPFGGPRGGRGRRGN